MHLSRRGLVAQSLFYVASGINHFWHGPSYVTIMPDHYPDPAALVGLTGAAEILGGLGLLLPATRRLAAGSIALMLVGFLDVHQFMIRHAERFPNVPKWILWGRIPLQFLFIAWVWKYTRRGTLSK